MDRGAQSLAAPGVVIGPSLRIGHEQIVERHAVAGRVDAGIDDRSATRTDADADAREEAGRIGREDADARRIAIGIALELHRRFGRADDALRLGHLSGIGALPAERFGKPVTVTEPLVVRGNGAARPFQCVGEFSLAPLDDLRATLLLVAEPEFLLGSFIECAQKPPLPVGPCPRAHGADVDDGEDEQHLEAFGALHLRAEVGNRGWVGKVAFEGGRAHQEMVPYEPGDEMRLVGIEPEARAEFERDVGAQFAMVAAAPLGDIVQQDRDVERTPRSELGKKLGGERMVVGQLATVDGGGQADRADGMLVDGIVMVHVELHLRDDLAEIGDEPAEHFRLVHPAEHRIGVVAPGQRVEEDGVGERVVADLVDAPRRSGGGPHRVGVNLQPLALRGTEKLEQANGIVLEPLLRPDREPPAIEREAVDRLLAAEDRRQCEAPSFLGKLRIELREEHAGEIAHRFGVQEVEVHEPLDRRFAGPIGIVHRFGDFLLVIEA